MAGRKNLPALLTVEEAARVLGIGRTAAYTQARMWRETAGLVGLPNIAVGDRYRVPTEALAAIIGRPVTHIPDVRRLRPQLRAGAPTGGQTHDGGVGVRRADRSSTGRTR